jgi:uncharacterized protein YxeA
MGSLISLIAIMFWIMLGVFIFEKIKTIGDGKLIKEFPTFKNIEELSSYKNYMEFRKYWFSANKYRALLELKGKKLDRGSNAYNMLKAFPDVDAYDIKHHFMVVSQMEATGYIV